MPAGPSVRSPVPPECEASPVMHGMAVWTGRRLSGPPLATRAQICISRYSGGRPSCLLGIPAAKGAPVELEWLGEHVIRRVHAVVPGTMATLTTVSPAARSAMWDFVYRDFTVDGQRHAPTTQISMAGDA